MSTHFQHASFGHPCVRTMRCPTCGVNAGQPCQTRTGKSAEPHVKRVRAHIINEARTPAEARAEVAE